MVNRKSLTVRKLQYVPVRVMLNNFLSWTLGRGRRTRSYRLQTDRGTKCFTVVWPVCIMLNYLFSWSLSRGRGKKLAMTYAQWAKIFHRKIFTVRKLQDIPVRVVLNNFLSWTLGIEIEHKKLSNTYEQLANIFHRKSFTVQKLFKYLCV